MEARLEEELAKVLKNKEELVSRISNLEEQGKKDKEGLDSVETLKLEIVDLKDSLSSVRISRDDCIRMRKN